MASPIGIFDSGYGGLTILKEIRRQLSNYDFIYLGDNARAPYGSRSFDLVYQFTRDSVKTLLDIGCELVILACNTASAKALRSIQQHDLPKWSHTKRVLGVIRPTAEIIGNFSISKHIGVVATPGTILSNSYQLEIKKIHPNIIVTGHACPMWVPLVENNEVASDGADFFIRKDLDALFAEDPLIDTIILGCTHYPLLLEKIKKYVPKNVTIISQGEYVAKSLCDYLLRHPEIDTRLTKNAKIHFLTTENTDKFNSTASIFLNEEVHAEQISVL